jgi:hypothetical protein
MHEARPLLALESDDRVLLPGRRGLEDLGVLCPPEALLLPPPVVVDGVVAGHRHEPGWEGPVGLVISIERLVHLDENLLCQILGLVHPPREAVGEAEDLAGVESDQLMPGTLVPATAPRQEFVDTRIQVWLAVSGRRSPATNRGNAPRTGQVRESRPS